MIGPSVFRNWMLAFCLFLQNGPVASGSESRHVFYSLEEALGRDERPALLVFFSTDCSVCWDDLLEMRLFLEQNKLRIQLVGICRDSEREVRNFLFKYSFFYPIVLDRRQRLFKAHHVDLVPFKVIVHGTRVIYRDDYYQDFFTRREEAKRCLMSIAPG